MCEVPEALTPHSSQADVIRDRRYVQSLDGVLYKLLDENGDVDWDKPVYIPHGVR